MLNRVANFQRLRNRCVLHLTTNVNEQRAQISALFACCLKCAQGCLEGRHGISSPSSSSTGCDRRISAPRSIAESKSGSSLYAPNRCSHRGFAREPAVSVRRGLSESPIAPTHPHHCWADPSEAGQGGRSGWSCRSSGRSRRRRGSRAWLRGRDRSGRRWRGGGVRSGWR